jgi:predicted N-acetyltransferase YhbS
MSVSSLPADLTFTIARERPQDADHVQALVERAFGPGRFVKAAERLREDNAPDLNLSFVAWAGGEAVGCVRVWPILIGDQPALLLGPFAVDDAWRSRGLGGELIERACHAARDQGRAGILLVGDEPYFRRFGFVASGQVILPGPVNPERVLWLNLSDAPLPSGTARAPSLKR